MTVQTVLPGHASDWMWARQIQQRFMEHSRTKLAGLDYSARCRQAHAIGGDFYDFLRLTDYRSAVAVGDASGKGLAGALMVSNVQSSIRTASFFAADNLPLTLDVVNRQVYKSSLPDRYATLFYCVFDSITRTLRYVNAGHQPPMVIRRDHSVALLDDGGVPVGMFSQSNYEEGAIKLEAGDLIVLCTDGVMEATNAEGREWGAEGVQYALAERDGRTPDETVDAIFRALDRYTDGQQADDMTVVALQVRC